MAFAIARPERERKREREREKERGGGIILVIKRNRIPRGIRILWDIAISTRMPGNVSRHWRAVSDV